MAQVNSVVFYLFLTSYGVAHCFWIPTHKSYRGPLLKPVGSACAPITTRFGPYIPREWRCHCDNTQPEGGYPVAKDLTVYPQLNEISCAETNDMTVCKPMENLVDGGKGCVVGKLQVFLPAKDVPYEPTEPYQQAFLKEQETFMQQYIVSQYRSHTCESGSLPSYCTNPDQKITAHVLDYGASPLGDQLKVLTKYFDGNVVGFNVMDEHTNPVQEYKHPGDYTLVWGSADKCVPFADETFDYVYSVNVVEHANPIEKYLHEALRVLKPGGLLYLKWYPVWYSARGHHVHEDIVEGWKEFFGKKNDWCYKVDYKNNGTIIPDWSHLWQTEQEWRVTLEKTTFANCPELINVLVEQVYNSTGLSRVSISQVLQFLEASGMGEVYKTNFQAFTTDVYNEIVQEVALKYGHGDILLQAAEIWVRRKAIRPGIFSPLRKLRRSVHKRDV